MNDDFTTNYFRAYDVELTNGLNTITLTVSDLAGNVTITNLNVTLDYSTATNPPVMQLLWPPNGAHLSGDAFYVRGWINDETASVKARILGRKSLFVLNSHATTVGNPFWPEVDWTWEGMDGTNLPGTDVVLGSLGPLGNAERLYLFLSDGETYDVTPTVLGNSYYTYAAPILSKHRLMHQTQCTALTDPRPDRTRLGVGEHVNFYFAPTVPLAFLEEPWWLAFAGSVSESSGQATVFTAPSNAATAIVRVFVRDAQLDTTFSVKEPKYEIANKFAEDTFAPGQQGVGMLLEPIVVFPTDVSFSRVHARELSGPASNVFGDCLNYTAEQLYHHTSAPANPYNCVNVKEFGDHPQHSGYRKLPGGFDYIIPVPWGVGSPDAVHGTMTRTQTFRITDTLGTSTITKMGATATRTP